VVSLCLPLRPHFQRSLLQGGFPEAALAEDLASVPRVGREDVVERVLNRDMTALYGMRSVLELEGLFVHCCLNAGGTLAQDWVASELGVTRATVANLLAALDAAHLIYRRLALEVGGKRRLKPRAKVYLADPSIRGAVLLRGEDSLNDPTEAGLVVETAVDGPVRSFFDPESPQSGDWRSDAFGREREVDIVVRRPGRWCIAPGVPCHSRRGTHAGGSRSATSRSRVSPAQACTSATLAGLGAAR